MSKVVLCYVLYCKVEKRERERERERQGSVGGCTVVGMIVS